MAHWDGKSWSQHASPTMAPLGGIAGTLVGRAGVAPSARDLWAVGADGMILHFDGNAWKQQPSPTTQGLFAVRAEDGSNAWAVGEKGTILHWDGKQWASSVSGTTSDLHGIWGPLARDLWVVGFSADTGRTSMLRRHR